MLVVYLEFSVNPINSLSFFSNAQVEYGTRQIMYYPVLAIRSSREAKLVSYGGYLQKKWLQQSAWYNFSMVQYSDFFVKIICLFLPKLCCYHKRTISLRHTTSLYSRVFPCLSWPIGVICISKEAAEQLCSLASYTIRSIHTAVLFTILSHILLTWGIEVTCKLFLHFSLMAGFHINLNVEPLS